MDKVIEVLMYLTLIALAILLAYGFYTSNEKTITYSIVYLLEMAVVFYLKYLSEK
jgi:hypothetical protein